MPIAPNDPRVATRPLTANERLADASIRHALHIERLGAGEERRVRGMLRRVHDDLVSIILDRLDRMIARAPDQTGLWTTARYAQMMARVSDVLREGHASVREELAMSLQEIGLAEVAYQGRLIADVMPFDVDLTLPGSREIRNIVRTRPFRGKLLWEWWGEQTVAVRRNIDTSLRVGLIEGESVTQIVSRIRREGGGVLPTSRRNMGAVVRTAVNHVSTAARSETAKANDDIVKGEQFVATLDSRTTLQCFPGSTRVLPIGRITAVFRREYAGEVLVVRTASGQEIVGTPNHPVLTLNGWLPLHEIKPGEKILRAEGAECVGVLADQNVGVPSSISEVFDAVSNPSVGDVLRERSAAAQFHGDGMCADSEVDIARPNRKLRSGANALLGEHAVEDRLGLCHGWVRLPSDRGPLKHPGRGRPSINAAQLDPRLSENAIEPTLRSTKLANDNCRSVSGIEKPDCAEAVVDDGIIRNPARTGLHGTNSLEKAGNRGSAGSEVTSDARSRFAGSVSVDDVISVGRKLHLGHVFNLETSSSAYIANGIIVHNCQSLDGSIFPIGSGPRPPIHFRCRSTTAPVLKSFREMGIDLDDIPEGTRAALDGEVAANVKYPEWIMRQPARIQNEALGVRTAQLLRDGKVSMADVVRKQRENLSRPLTLAQVRKLGGL